MRTILLLLVTTLAFGQNPIEINDRLELFVDDYLIEKMEGAHLELHNPRDEGPVIKFDKPWEGIFSGYTTIIKDGRYFRAYYRGMPRVGGDNSARESTCYAESLDGINWVKPNLGQFLVDSTYENNIILADSPPHTHNFCPFLDTNPNVKPSERYKAVGGSGESGLTGFVSADGIKWTKISEEPIFTKGIFDSQNVVFWSDHEDQYVMYFRTWTGNGYSGYRTVSKSTSKDFVNWTDPQKMDFGGTPNEHLYTNQTSPYFRAPHIYIAIAARFMPGRKVLTDYQAKELGVNPKYFNDCSDAVLISSRGGYDYDRTFMESYIRPGIGLENWVSRSNYPALNVVQTSDTEMSLYINQDYAQPTAHLRRYSMRIDGFSSVQVGYSSGYVLTKPLIFKGSKLILNYSTSAAGSVKVEFYDIKGEVIESFSEENCQEIIGNQIERIVEWNGSSDLAELSGKAVSIKFILKDADLYSFKFE